MKKPKNKLFLFLSSFGLAATIFVFAFFLILFGTLYQVDHGLYEAQHKYFSSMFVLHMIGPLAIPLPGGYVLMVALMINLICGGLIRIRKNIRRPGVIIGHIGIMVLLVSAGVTYHLSDRGHMRLYPGEQSDIYESYNDWNIEIGKPASKATLWLIADKQIRDLGPDDSRTFYREGESLEVSVHGYALNSVPVRVPEGQASVPGVVDGFRLETLPNEKESEINVPGAYVTVTDTDTGDTTEGILWGLDLEPLTVQSGDVYYTLGLARKKYRAPFVVRVDDFRLIQHAGTSMAASYEADVTKIENGAEESVLIWMNHPLRRSGYTYFQSSYGPPSASPGDRMYTVFEVVRNPADHGPLVACIIVSIGLLIHFLQKLGRYMKAETKRRVV